MIATITFAQPLNGTQRRGGFRMENYFDREARNWDKENYRIVRAQTIAEAIHREIPLNQKMRGLDFGCGTGLLGFSLIDKLAHMTFWDNSEGMIDRVNGKIEADFHERGKALVYDLFSRRVESLFDVIV
ncbi:MAG: class I SAM-dependent methyltransferase, partial [Spirochaetales bacterium]|nr:class I SAM-dependent methyltransferase [Spirochaetales bacterium]